MSNNILLSLQPGVYYMDKQQDSTLIKDHITPGYYSCNRSMQQLYIQSYNFCSDVVVPFIGKVYEEIESYSKTFFSKESEEYYKNTGAIHKACICFYGVPGTGKTIMAKVICDWAIEHHNAIVLTGETPIVVSVIKHIRSTGNQQYIVYIQDEGNYSVYEYRREWLTFLDGEDSQERVLTLFCTNTVSDFVGGAKRYWGRPSRVDRYIEMPPLSREMSIALMVAKHPELAGDDGIEAINYIYDYFDTLKARDPEKEGVVTADVIKGYLKNIYLSKLTKDQAIEAAVNFAVIDYYKKEEE